MVCFLALFILLQCVLQHTVTALENRDPNIEENNLHKQLFHYETLKKSDISLHVRHHRDVDTGHVTARTYVTFFTLGMKFSMVLKAGSPVLAPGLKAHTVDRNGKYEPLHVDSNDFLTGHLQEDKSIHVYAHYEEDILCTTVYFPNETYFTEPSWRHLPSSSGLDLISYRLSDVNWNNTGDFPKPVILPHFSNGSSSSDKQHQKFRQKRQSRVTKKLCSIRLVADYYFYSQYARFSASRALQAMVNSIQEANRIYQDTPWDLAEPFGWGFVIKQILVHTELSDGYWGGPFSYNLKEMESNPFIKLDAFSIHEDLLKFCLAHLFTTTSFENGIVGLGYMANDRHPGGICSSYYYHIIPRTGLTTTMTTTGLHLVRTHHQLVTVHGHNWGSDHDTPGPCAPSDDDGGRYIMYEQSVHGYQPNHFRFSNCSIRSISETLRWVSQECFTDSTTDTILCGNGVVDILEECDAGEDGLEGKDECCSSICLLRENARCSDFNSKCCRNCSVAPKKTICKQDAGNRCLKSSKCDGVSPSCPAVPVADNTPCLQGGMCFKGKCLLSCERLQTGTNKVYKPCKCEDYEHSVCRTCCMQVFGDGSNGSCFPTKDRLGFGEPCSNGVCNEQGQCINKKETHCGNGVLDKGEECDAGDSSINEDKCCKSTCRLRESAQCSDVNNMCCTDCQIALKGAVCSDNYENMCMEIATCDGVSPDCLSTMSKKNGTACGYGGQCLGGRCITSHFHPSASTHKDSYKNCLCEHNDSVACKHCYTEVSDNGTYGPCFPTDVPLGFRERCYKGVCNQQGQCVPEKDVPCGNGVLDEREECDAGKNGVKNLDKCCNSTCYLREFAQCSNINKACCRDCKIAPKGTVCEANFDLPCMETGKCDGVSPDCLFDVPKENGTVCYDTGLCHNGRCITNYCKMLGLLDNRFYRPCMCEHNASAACKRCCLEVFDNDTNGPCFPTNKTLRPGQRCYNGECDEKGLCISLEGVVMVRFIKFFFKKDFNAIEEAMKTNVVMIVVFLTALFWIPASCYISYIDRKNAKAACEKQKAKKPASISSHEIQLKKMSIKKNQVEPVVDLPAEPKSPEATNCELEDLEKNP